jgi:hypothetical protein
MHDDDLMSSFFLKKTSNFQGTMFQALTRAVDICTFGFNFPWLQG